MNSMSNFHRPEIRLDTVFTRSTNLATSNILDEICMFDIQNGKYYAFNLIGSRIWELLDCPKSIKNIISTLLQEYNVGKEMCEESVLEFILKLYNEKIIFIQEESI